MFERFKSKREVIEDLVKDNKHLTERVDILNKEMAKMQRVMKHAGNQPSFELNYTTHFMMIGPDLRNYVLYLYIDYKEYIIELDVLPTYFYAIDDGKLTVDDNFAVFTISSDIESYEFIIDYKRGTYVHSVRNIKTEEQTNDN